MESKFNNGMRRIKHLVKKTSEEENHGGHAETSTNEVKASSGGDKRLFTGQHFPMPDGPRRLHVGCGENRLEGWVNLDISEDSKADLLCNAAVGRIPFEDGSIDVMHSEDFIEHLPLDSGGHFLRECFRILKPGGYMRLLTPDLLSFTRDYINRDKDHFKWYADNFKCRTWAEAFNFGMRMGGHTFLYDEETLDLVLKETGFEVMPAKPNESECPDLCGIDIRLEGITIYRDCRKPEAPGMP